MNITDHVIGTRPVSALRLQHCQNLLGTTARQNIGVGTEVHIPISLILTETPILLDAPHVFIHRLNQLGKPRLIRWKNPS